MDDTEALFALYTLTVELVAAHNAQMAMKNNKIEQLTTENKEMREALRLCAPTNQRGAMMFDAVTAGLVRPFCEARGYGNVMQATAALWYAKDPDGAFTVGPCALTVRQVLEVEANNATR